MVGGGVRGKDVGIARGTTTRVGATTKEFRLFMQRYPQAGGMTTGPIIGEGISGTTSEYLSNKFNGTGGAGKRAGIGRSSKPGGYKVCNRERDHSNHPEKCNHDSPGHKQARPNQAGHNHNTKRRVHNHEGANHNHDRRLNHNTKQQVHNHEGANRSTHSSNRGPVKEVRNKKTGQKVRKEEI